MLCLIKKSIYSSAVGIATCYGLEGRFSAPVQKVPGVQPVSWTMCTGSSLRVQRPKRGVNHPPESSAEVKEKREL